MNWEYILEVPFISKKKYLKKSPTAKYEYSGVSYYLLDKDGKVLRDFILINENDVLEYRPNDNAMMIGESGCGTDFWRKLIKRGIDRRNYFSSSPINKLEKKADLSTKKKINSFSLKYANTSLKVDGFISGSNSSGADTKIEATPLYISSGEFYGLRYINPLKAMRLKRGNRDGEKRYLIDLEILNNSQKLTLKEYLLKFNTAKKWFYKFNPESYELLFSAKEYASNETYFRELKKDKLKNELKSNIENIAKLLSRYANGLMTKDILVSRFRGIQRMSLMIEKEQKGFDVITNRHEKSSNMDAAHIIEVRNIKKMNDKYLYLIADKNNGLLLPKDIHYKFDKDEEFKIDNDFNLIEKNKIIGTINKEYITKERVENLRKRNLNSKD